MSKTETVHTEYGAVSIETVECDSCGNTIAKEDASRFALGEGTVHGFEDAERHGYACPICVDEGPISFPNYERWGFNIPEEGEENEASWVTMCIFAPIWIPLVMTVGAFDSEVPQSIVFMMWIVVFWLVGASGAVLYLF